MAQYVKIPMERVAVVIGKDGETKRMIEEQTKTKLKIADTVVEIEGEDSLLELTARDIVLAIGRGFSPEVAMQLLREDYVLDVIRLPDHLRTKRSLQRIRGRVIGKEGKIRRDLEALTGAYISVQGKTVAIIGSYESAELAREAVLRIVGGAQYSSVYRFLEAERRKLRTVL